MEIGMPLTAKLMIENGAQVIHLPRGTQLPGSEAVVRLEGDTLILRPKASSWDDFFARRSEVPDDFLAERADPPCESKELL